MTFLPDTFENLGFESHCVGRRGTADHWEAVSLSSVESAAGYRSFGGNVLTYSEQFDNSAWIKETCTISADTVFNPPCAPLGTDADSLVDTAADDVHRIYQEVSGSGAVCFSCFLKKAAVDYAYLKIDSEYVFFNLDVGGIGTISDNAVATITDIGSGWYWCSLSGELASPAQFRIGAANADNDETYAGAGSAAIYLYGAQVNLDSSLTAYLKTEASIVYAVKAAENFEEFWNENESYLYSLLQAGATVAEYGTVIPLFTKYYEDFEELWNSNEEYQFVLGPTTAADYQVDVGTVAYEGFEEEWYDNQNFLHAFAPTDLTAAVYEGAEAYEDFEEGWNNDTYYTSLPSVTAALYDTTPEAYEDFEEDWPDIQMSTI